MEATKRCAAKTLRRLCRCICYFLKTKVFQPYFSKRYSTGTSTQNYPTQIRDRNNNYVSLSLQLLVVFFTICRCILNFLFISMTKRNLSDLTSQENLKLLTDAYLFKRRSLMSSLATFAKNKFLVYYEKDVPPSKRRRLNRSQPPSPEGESSDEPELADLVDDSSLNFLDEEEGQLCQAMNDSMQRNSTIDNGNSSDFVLPDEPECFPVAFPEVNSENANYVSPFFEGEHHESPSNINIDSSDFPMVNPSIEDYSHKLSPTFEISLDANHQASTSENAATETTQNTRNDSSGAPQLLQEYKYDFRKYGFASPKDIFPDYEPFVLRRRIDDVENNESVSSASDDKISEASEDQPRKAVYGASKRKFTEDKSPLKQREYQISPSLSEVKEQNKESSSRTVLGSVSTNSKLNNNEKHENNSKASSGFLHQFDNNNYPNVETVEESKSSAKSNKRTMLDNQDTNLDSINASSSKKLKGIITGNSSHKLHDTSNNRLIRPQTSSDSRCASSSFSKIKGESAPSCSRNSYYDPSINYDDPNEHKIKSPSANSHKRRMELQESQELCSQESYNDPNPDINNNEQKISESDSTSLTGEKCSKSSKNYEQASKSAKQQQTSSHPQGLLDASSNVPRCIRSVRPWADLVQSQNSQCRIRFRPLFRNETEDLSDKSSSDMHISQARRFRATFVPGGMINRMMNNLQRMPLQPNGSQLISVFRPQVIRPGPSLSRPAPNNTYQQPPINYHYLAYQAFQYMRSSEFPAIFYLTEVQSSITSQEQEPLYQLLITHRGHTLWQQDGEDTIEYLNVNMLVCHYENLRPEQITFNPANYIRTDTLVSFMRKPNSNRYASNTRTASGSQERIGSRIPFCTINNEIIIPPRVPHTHPLPNSHEPVLDIPTYMVDKNWRLVRVSSAASFSQDINNNSNKKKSLEMESERRSSTLPKIDEEPDENQSSLNDTSENASNIEGFSANSGNDCARIRKYTARKSRMFYVNSFVPVYDPEPNVGGDDQHGCARTREGEPTRTRQFTFVQQFENGNICLKVYDEPHNRVDHSSEFHPRSEKCRDGELERVPVFSILFENNGNRYTFYDRRFFHSNTLHFGTSTDDDHDSNTPEAAELEIEDDDFNFEISDDEEDGNNFLPANADAVMERDIDYTNPDSFNVRKIASFDDAVVPDMKQSSSSDDSKSSYAIQPDSNAVNTGINEQSNQTSGPTPATTSQLREEKCVPAISGCLSSSKSKSKPKKKRFCEYRRRMIYSFLRAANNNFVFTDHTNTSDHSSDGDEDEYGDEQVVPISAEINSSEEDVINICENISARAEHENRQIPFTVHVNKTCTNFIFFDTSRIRYPLFVVSICNRTTEIQVYLRSNTLSERERDQIHISQEAKTPVASTRASPNEDMHSLATPDLSDEDTVHDVRDLDTDMLRLRLRVLANRNEYINIDADNEIRNQTENIEGAGISVYEEEIQAEDLDVSELSLSGYLETSAAIAENLPSFEDNIDLWKDTIITDDTTVEVQEVVVETPVVTGEYVNTARLRYSSGADGRGPNIEVSFWSDHDFEELLTSRFSDDRQQFVSHSREYSIFSDSHIPSINYYSSQPVVDDIDYETGHESDTLPTPKYSRDKVLKNKRKLRKRIPKKEDIDTDYRSSSSS